jgi:regulation of enolase protein 1 (concanavalin A-like superfamily)
VTGERTDFWQTTWYGFQRDSGHFLGVPAKGDFTARVRFKADYQTLYDQAGLMLRIDAATWIKAGIELSDGATNFSTVVTRGESDWSVVRRPLVSGEQEVRLVRRGGAVVTHFRDPAGSWQLMRLTHFPDLPEVLIGPMGCTPERGGLEVTITGFELGPPLEDALHG